MQDNNEPDKPQDLGPGTCPRRKSGREKTGEKDPKGLPDGSGTNREGAGSEQGQEDGGQTFDAG